MVYVLGALMTVVLFVLSCTVQAVCLVFLSTPISLPILFSWCVKREVRLSKYLGYNLGFSRIHSHWSVLYHGRHMRVKRGDCGGSKNEIKRILLICGCNGFVRT